MITQDQKYEAVTIDRISTNKVVLTAFLDAFEIGKVRLQVTQYHPHKSIDIYIGFSDALRLADDISTGRILRMLDANPNLIVAQGGTKKSSKMGGRPESRILTLTKANDVIFFNGRSGLGILDRIIKPTNENVTKIGVPTKFEDIKGMFLNIKAHIEAYLVYKVRNSLNINNTYIQQQREMSRNTPQGQAYPNYPQN